MKKEAVAKTFQKYVRLRDSVKGYGHCCTCGKLVHWKDADAGHFVSRKHNATLFHEQNCHLQCKGCNGFGHGEQYQYSKFLDKKYGHGTAEMLMTLKNQVKKFSDVELQILDKMYKEKINSLLLENE